MRAASHIHDLEQPLVDLGAKPVHVRRLLRTWLNALPEDAGRSKPELFLMV
ncbi:MAG: hypothetical protein RL375_2780 [Pseudomonadota bacterium]